jgi:hypothetical protein
MERLWTSATETADAPDKIELVFYLDDDDEVGIEKYHEMRKAGKNVVAAQGPRQEIGSQMWNEAYKKATGEILMLASDDIVFRTSSWDTMTLAWFYRSPDRIRYVWGHDGSRYHRRWGTHGFVHQNWVKAVGYFAPPLTFYGIDDWFTVTARKTGRAHFIGEMSIEHMHWSYGKTEGARELKKTRGDETARYRNKHFGFCVRELNQLKRDSEYAPKLVCQRLREFVQSYNKK